MIPMAAGLALRAGTPAFSDVTVAAGIHHRHHKPVLDHQLDNIMAWVSSVGAAAATADYDRDGWLDVYMTDSRHGHPNRLYRNQGDGTFTDVAARAGVAEVNHAAGDSMDCVWGDVDNDGWPDLYVVRWGYDALFRNRGDGTFVEVTTERFRRRDGTPGVDWANGCAATFLDYNRDGRADLYVGNYFDAVNLYALKTTRIMHDDFEKARNAGRNFLYRQNPDGTFTEVAGSLGLDDPGWTLAVGAADVNNDGWPDLYCADDFGPDQFFLNRGDGTFTNATEAAIGLDTKKGMNVDFGDFDNDGWLDIYVANITTAEYLQEGNMLWHNEGANADGGVTFSDIALETGTYDGGWGWGAKFLDFDQDGRLDLFAVNGFISAGSGNYWYDLASWTVKGLDVADARNWPTIGDRSFSGYERNRFWHNTGGLAFRERAAEFGLDSDRDGRGVVAFDYDNDGDLDLLVANQDQAPQLYRNNLPATNHWLAVRLVSDPTTRITRDALGARVTLTTVGQRQIREQNGGKCYAGQSDPRLYFGLGGDDRIVQLEVRWPDGGRQRFSEVLVDRCVTLQQDPQRYVLEPSLALPAPRRPVTASGSRPPATVPPPPDPAAVEQDLAERERALASALDAFRPASLYRARCVAAGQHDRAVRFFAKLVAADPAHWRARLELACAYVDKIPTCGGMAAIVSKGTLAQRSLDQLDAVIARHPDSWVAHYARGINHLHWPRALRHSDDAAADLSRCVALQERAGTLLPYHRRAYVALGDAHAKARDFAKARQAWERGSRRFPDAAELQQRLALEDGPALLRFVEAQRSLEQSIDTDLGFLDPPEP